MIYYEYNNNYRNIHENSHKLNISRSDCFNQGKHKISLYQNCSEGI